MTPAIILVLLLCAFIIARMMRSTKMWWRLLFAIMAGLLVGMLSKGLTESKDSANLLTELISTMDNNSTTMDMQSLVATVTEGTTDCQSGVASYPIVEEELFDALINVTCGTNGRDSPLIWNDS